MCLQGSQCAESEVGATEGDGEAQRKGDGQRTGEGEASQSHTVPASPGTTGPQTRAGNLSSQFSSASCTTTNFQLLVNNSRSMS